MNKNIIFTIILLIAPLFSFAQNDPDRVIKERIIQESINRYSGNCPCPYNVMKNGSRCGKRSAYSKPKGYSPKCYIEDITPQEVNLGKQKNNTR